VETQIKSLSDVRNIIRELVTDTPIRGLEVGEANRQLIQANSDSSHYRFRYRRSFTCSVTLHVSLDDVVSDTSDAEYTHITLKPRVEITWPSSALDLSEAVSSLTLYREVIDLGAELQMRLDEEPVIYTVDNVD
jgi:hypothetical protein